MMPNLFELEQTIVSINQRLASVEDTNKSNDLILKAVGGILERLSGIEEKFSSSTNDEILQKLDEKSEELSANLKVSTDSIKDDILSIRQIVIEKQSAEIRSLRIRSAFLQDRLFDCERSLNQQQQQSRKVNFEIAGIPSSVE